MVGAVTGGMNSLQIFPWEDSFNLGLHIVDAQHQQLVVMLNALGRQCAQDAASQEVLALFDDLAQFAVLHFQSEMEVWQGMLGSDPETGVHQQEHDDFVSKAMALRQELLAPASREVAEAAIYFVAAWLAEHLLYSDRFMARFGEAIKAGHSREVAWAQAEAGRSGEAKALIDCILSISQKHASNTFTLMRKLAEREQDRRALVEANSAQGNSSKLLQTVIKTVPIRIFWKGRDYRYLGCNDAFARDAGLDDPATLIGRDDFELSWASNADAYRRDDRAVIESGVARLNYEETQTTPDGGRIVLQSSKVPLLDQQGEIIGVLGIYDDITGRKESEEKVDRKSVV